MPALTFRADPILCPHSIREDEIGEERSFHDDALPCKSRSPAYSQFIAILNANGICPSLTGVENMRHRVRVLLPSRLHDAILHTRAHETRGIRVEHVDVRETVAFGELKIST